MGRIDISFETVRQKSDKLSSRIQCKLEEEIIVGYEKLEENIFQSDGEVVDMIVEELRQEKEALIEMKKFMEIMLQLVKESANAFEQVDARYQAIFKNYGGEIEWEEKMH